MHAHWIMLLQKFTFVIKHKARKINLVAYAFSWRANLLISVDTSFTGMESLQQQYKTDVIFYSPGRSVIRTLHMMITTSRKGIYSRAINFVSPILH